MVGLSCSLQMECKLVQALQLAGGATESIFPQVEAVLLNDTEYQKALEFVGSMKDKSRYHSTMDFFFCELVPEYRKKCFLFYDDKGKQLKDILTIQEIVYYGKLLLKALEIAYEMYCEKRETSWTKFRYAVLKAAA